MAFGLIVLFASYLIYSYATLSPVIDALKPLSFFAWTAGHRPMAGVSDWPSVGAAGRRRRSCCSPIGVVGFVRRDLGGVGERRLAPPALAAGRHRRAVHAASWPTGRASPSPGVWASGCTAILIVASADAFSDMIAQPAADRGPHRGDLPGPRPDPAVGRPPADVLRLRLVHHRPVGGHVPGRLGRRRGPASPRGRPVDAAVAGLVGVPERARGAWPRSAS